MKKFLFTVYDSAAEMYLDPFVAPTVEFAIRGFREAVNQDGHQFGKFPQDYTLFAIGEFEPQTGMLIPANISSLGVAITFMDKQSDQIALQEWDRGI